MVKIGHPSMSGMFELPSRDWAGRLQYESKLDVIEDYVQGDWRSGKEISKVVITQRIYQISPNSTQA